MKKQDIILIGVLLAIALVSLFYMKITEKEGNCVNIYVDGELISTYAIDQNGEYIINGVNGSTNTLVIKDGKAYLEDASCPDLLCVHQGSIEYDGETIVCLPNKVVIEIINENKKSDVDIIVG